MPRKFLFALAFAALSVAAMSPAAAQHPLFAEHSEIQILIEGPVDTLVRRAARNVEPVPATLSVTGHETRWQIQLEPRGVSRRTGGLCSFPPMRVDFDEGTRGTLFQGQNRIKVVTRCRNGAAFEQLTVLEYLAYRMYNEITPWSYAVRPATITYRDRRDEVQFNFLIEDVDDLARRNERWRALDVATGEVRSTQLNPRAATQFALFQFMIGNLDWDMIEARSGRDCCHNSRLLASSNETRENLIAAPYDFDYSGFVNAPYALPPESLPVRNVRQRYYRGYCRFNDQLPEAIAHFQARREAIFALIDNEPRLSDSRRVGARRFIEEFYQTISDPAQVERQLINRCRGGMN
ncbi:MAG TPA: hypothetical protein PKY87_01420 [Terricaulis sp.]|nr:hypothetical protein [Terricaulis sp.]